MPFTEDVLKKLKSATQEDKKDLVLTPDYIDRNDLYEDIDTAIERGGVDFRLKKLKKLYGENELKVVNENSYCFEYQSDSEGKYELTNDEVQILHDINDSASDILGLNIGELYKTTKIILCDGPSDSDLLGSYSLEDQSPYCTPVVRLYMDRITEASRLYCNRKYVTASVYIHEMMHRYYDIRPDLGWKKSVDEIEEPMAVFGAMKFCEEFDKETLLQISRRLTEDLRKSKWYDLLYYYVYILGIKMYDSNVDACLIETYRHVSLMMHKESEVKGFDNPIGKYLDTCEKKKDSLENLVEPIKKCIETYAKFFPQDKGTK